MAKVIVKSSEYRPLVTKRGLFLLTLILIGPLAGIVSNWPFATAVALASATLTLLFAVFLVSQFRLRRIARRLSATAMVASPLYVASQSQIAVHLHHPQKAPASAVALRFFTPQGITFLKPYFESKLQRQSRTSLTCEFIADNRGKFSWNCVWIRLYSENKFCALQFRLEFDCATATEVFPNPQLYRLNVANRAAVALPGTFRHEQSGGEGREFDRLRKYSSGDDLRRVDWKRSSTRGSILVKAYRPETLQRVSILLDCSRRMSNAVGKRLQIDYAVDAAAFLLEKASINGDQVAFLAFDHRKLKQVPSGHGRTHQKLILDYLRDVAPGQLEADYDLVRGWAQQTKRRSLMVLITSLNTPASVDSIKNALLSVRHKHLSLVAAINDRDLTNLLNSPAASLDDAYAISAGFEQQQAINSRLEVLRRSGIDCVYGDAKALPALAARRYYELKMQGKL